MQDNDDVSGVCYSTDVKLARFRMKHLVCLAKQKSCYTTKNKRYFLIPYNSLADVVRLLAARSDTNSNVKLGGFRSQLQASKVSSHTEELWYNEIVCLWMTIYINIYINMITFKGDIL